MLEARLRHDLGIEDSIPDHSAFTRARNKRFREHDIFRSVFERIVTACIKAGLVGGADVEATVVDRRCTLRADILKVLQPGGGEPLLAVVPLFIGVGERVAGMTTVIGAAHIVCPY